MTKSTSGRTHNTSIDSSIDLKSYIASAKKTNQEIIENAGTQINAKTSEYMSTGKAFRAALTEKYSKLAAEVKTHSNPENYMQSYVLYQSDSSRNTLNSYQNTGCRGTRDTLTISASGKEKLTKSTSGRTHNTSIYTSLL